MRQDVLEGLNTLVHVILWVVLGILTGLCLLLILRSLGLGPLPLFRRRPEPDEDSEDDKRRRRMRRWFWDRGYRQNAARDEDEDR
jgi:hypothetical protein